MDHITSIWPIEISSRELRKFGNMVKTYKTSTFSVLFETARKITHCYLSAIAVDEVDETNCLDNTLPSLLALHQKFNFFSQF